MAHRIIPAIMSGGAGARLWPLSTDAAPKQFHALSSNASLFADTVLRVKGETGALSFAPPLVLCNASHTAAVRAECAAAGVAADALVLEPKPRNTAAVGAIAAALAAERDPDALVLLLPADHVITDVAAFHAAIARAAPFARERILTFGIEPDRPATGYGYIHRGAQLGDGVFAIEAFKEKPLEPVAREYLAAGGYCWNSGMFLFHPATLLKEFDARADIRDAALAALGAAARVGDEVRLDAALFEAVPSVPLDIAVMEQTARAAVVPCEIGWADIGAWDEIWRLADKDSAGNVTHGAVVALDASNNLLRSESAKLCVAGVSDLVVIATKEAIIIVPRDKAQDVKTLKDLAEKL
ncbi:MAG: sugar phosphate nucleotidyltransferase [Hyphomonadaceae bacterium]